MDETEKLRIIKQILEKATVTRPSAADPNVPVVPRVWIAKCLSEATGEGFSLPVVNMLCHRFIKSLRGEKIAIRANKGSKWLRLAYLEKFVRFALTFSGHTDDIRAYARYWATIKANPGRHKVESPIEAIYQANREKGIYDGLICGGTYARNLALQKSALHFAESQKHGSGVLVLGSKKYTDCLEAKTDD